MNERFQLPMPSILLAEDDEAVAGLLRRFLVDAKYKVESVRHGRAAIFRLRRARFDILITDLSLPDIDGLDVIGFARDMQPNIRILAISGFLVEAFVRVATRCGANGTLQKPFRREAFLRSVGVLLQAESRAVSARAC